MTVTERPHHCSTLCATTYKAARDRRRVTTTIAPTFSATSTSEDTESSDDVGKIVPLRRKSRFQIKKEETKKLVEGRWKQVGSRNYEEYLTELGRSCTVLSVLRTCDRCRGLHCPHDDEGRPGAGHPAGGGQAVEARHGDAHQGQVC